MRCGEAGFMLLDHVSRYRVTTIEAVYALYYSERTREAARKALARLAGEGFLRRFELRNRSFYQLTARGCAEIGAPKRAGQHPHSAQALLDHYAVLSYCALHGPQKTRLSRHELAQVCPEAQTDRRINPELQPFCLEKTSERLRLSRLTIDGGAAVPSLVQKVRQIERETKKTALARLVQEGAFTLVLLTSHATKATRLREALDRAQIGMPAEVAVVVQMKHL